MAYLLIPNEVSETDAIVWIAVINEASDANSLSLFCNGVAVVLDQNWSSFTTQNNQNKIQYRYVTVSGLQAGSENVFELFSQNSLLRDCRIRTLPDRLPTINEPPFSVLLASCFCSSRSESGTLGSTYLNLLRQQKIDLKILCGDQVYLDDPALHFTWHRHSPADLEDRLFGNYVRTWTQESLSAGFRQFLQNGANYFTSDDHEFWNNAPNRATLILDTWTQNGRNAWMNIASSLLGIFQRGHATSTFNVGTLSFFIADTRMNRDPNRQNFMSPADLNALDNWVTGLQGVGVLVIGQPLFSKKAGFWGNLTDWNLPDYVQYADLARVLSKTNHSILLLTGDVHYGRISRCQLKPDVFLYEIISSPTALVNDAVGGSWHAAPDLFPAFAIPGLVQKQIENDFSYKFTANHFLTLNFFQDGSRTRVRVNNVHIFGNGQSPVSIQRADLILS